VGQHTPTKKPTGKVLKGKASKGYAISHDAAPELKRLMTVEENTGKGKASGLVFPDSRAEDGGEGL